MTTSVAINDSARLSIPLDNQHEDWIIARAIEITERRVFQRSNTLQNPTEVRDYLRMKLASERNEVFSVVFLDNRHRVIAFDVLFKGTIDASSVYPRVVLSKALEHNAAAVIFAHNHPSGVTEPSLADKAITERLASLLTAVDIRVLDHFIIGEGKPFSFAEMGLL
uniref:JAB domain-containing protein n=1 Tax=Marinobacterium profundum TaxID=1714300 RepID=UPI0008370B30|nr:DNA repair protein RadC [Marinobacterium profundum]